MRDGVLYGQARRRAMLDCTNCSGRLAEAPSAFNQRQPRCTIHPTTVEPSSVCRQGLHRAKRSPHHVADAGLHRAACGSPSTAPGRRTLFTMLGRSAARLGSVFRLPLNHVSLTYAQMLIRVSGWGSVRWLSQSSETALSLSSLTAVGSIDGRYERSTAALRPYFSEFALIRFRVLVEVEWLRALSETPDIKEIPKLSAGDLEALGSIAERFSEADARRVKEIERTTNHDVKAVEYFIKERVRVVVVVDGACAARRPP